MTEDTKLSMKIRGGILLPILIPIVFAQLNITASLWQIQYKDPTQLIPYNITNANVISTQQKSYPQLIPYNITSANIYQTNQKQYPELIPYKIVTPNISQTQINQPPSLQVLSSAITIYNNTITGTVSFIIYDKEASTADCFIMSTSLSGTYFNYIGTFQTNTNQTANINVQVPEQPIEVWLFCIPDYQSAQALLKRLFPAIILKYRILYSPSYIVLRIPEEYTNRPIYKITYKADYEKLLPTSNIVYRRGNILVIKLPEPATEINIYMV